MKTCSIDNLTEEQLRLITETLLFSSTVDVNANWYYENYEQMFKTALDIRKNSVTYGEHISIELTEENKTMLYIPPGFAHGFLTLKDNTIFSYKCTNLYNKASEGTVLWNDQNLKINWNVTNPILSEKDIVGTIFSEFNSPF